MTAPRTCDELAVCQDKSPRCSKCKPSEGTKSARDIWEILKQRELIQIPRHVRKGVH